MSPLFLVVVFSPLLVIVILLSFHLHRRRRYLDLPQCAIPQPLYRLWPRSWPTYSLDQKRLRLDLTWLKVITLYLLCFLCGTQIWNFDCLVGSIDHLYWSLKPQQPFQATEILPGLWLGNKHDGRNYEALVERNIRSVVIAANDFYPRESWTDFDWMKIELQDRREEDIFSHFLPAAAWITERRDRGEGVLVHCVYGKSRSVSIVASYLMMRVRVSYVSALRFIQKRRPSVLINLGYAHQLKKLENFISKAEESRNQQLLVDCGEDYSSPPSLPSPPLLVRASPALKLEMKANRVSRRSPPPSSSPSPFASPSSSFDYRKTHNDTETKEKTQRFPLSKQMLVASFLQKNNLHSSFHSGDPSPARRLIIEQNPSYKILRFPPSFQASPDSDLEFYFKFRRHREDADQEAVDDGFDPIQKFITVSGKP